MSGERTAVTPDAVWPEDTDEAEAVLVDWFVTEGASVTEGETLCTIQVEKVDIDVPAPADGTLVEIGISEDQVCAPGDTLGWIEG
ncbi:Pyruvate/2-oxoglutarate dehydrogenase complex, dihydrolipoamide acyltransferase (E2) component [Halanaeroarchaeum sp. HSR-CO]|uniref:lipoyl domain-containing protein n=1 Tax=Halanaeroarchaeum sp. HSR-CO TaxID=2866382 RepID=UPI00217E5649|nr:lipoyl domain-containing protein [Halanaeroarchaeum sp. HSR-CO]UWG46845.1 Pyruvate/2-oxoglutarate dehydrogenase complex, dihydrolipoamide acyltransferase (E2) component [Halanaeroarchaeum sp. HSR-CO]